MRAYLVKRCLQALLVFVGIGLVVFLLLHLTGDPTLLLLPPEASPEDIELLRKQMGFDDPLYIQYWRFFKGTLRGDFGDSFRHNQPAIDLVIERVPATVELATVAMIIALAVALPVGIFSAVRRDTSVDHLGMAFALLGQSMPVFWLGLMLVLVFSVNLHWLPATGRGDWSQIVLPAITLAMFSMGRIARLVRSGMLETLNQDYIRTAESKGLGRRRIICIHALRNTSVQIITIVGMEVGTLLGGAVITETIFAWPGVGRLAIQAIYNRDYPVVQADVFMLALIFVVINLVTDILYSYLDPRVRFE